MSHTIRCLAVAACAGPICVTVGQAPPPVDAESRLSVWYAPANPIPSPRFDWPAPRRADAVDGHLAALRRAYAGEFERLARDPFVARVHAAGARVVYASSFAPAAVVSGGARALERVRRLTEVRSADPGAEYVLEQDVSAMTTRADAVTRLPVPVDGTGVSLCVLERDSVQNANPYIPPVTYYQPPPAVRFAQHPTAVAGIIAARHSTYRGQSPGVTLLNANAGSFQEAAILRASDWAIRQGANSINASFGSNTSGNLRLLDRYYDHVVRHLLVHFIKGAGNTGSWVVSPGLGYNSITVGNSFDRKTPHWSDDTVNSSSGHQDPVTGHPKPEIVAPGTQLTGTIHVQPWIGAIGSGGSYAGPQGNAVAALIMERDPRLKLRPEAVKATILASAWHKIETQLVGARDGTGQLNAFAADAVVRAGAFR